MSFLTIFSPLLDFSLSLFLAINVTMAVPLESARPRIGHLRCYYEPRNGFQGGHYGHRGRIMATSRPHELSALVWGTH